MRPNDGAEDIHASHGRGRDRGTAQKQIRPTTAYFLWMLENRARVKDENPGFNVAEIAKECGRQWAAVADKEKWERRNNFLREKWKKERGRNEQSSRSHRSLGDERSGSRARSLRSSSGRRVRSGGSIWSGGGLRSGRNVRSARSSRKRRSKGIRSEPM